MKLEDAWLGVFRRRTVRRSFFNVHIRKDRSLDKFLHKMVKGSVGPALVAFGSADMMIKGVGFGYAPAPHKRMRRRLSLVHGARVTLIQEYNTSRCCSICHADLESVTVTMRKWLDAEKKWKRQPSRKVKKIQKLRLVEERVELHALKKCTSDTCRRQNQRTRVLHRDDNAARNMIAVYKSLAKHGRRPKYLSRPEKLKKKRVVKK